ncbi:heme response regulator HssR [Paenibacillus sp. FSL H7-0357]|uniref:response regulator transcription factor n=1 Tax=Paenibacillus sp. FSL H7-0357 TaxID=1536774 RepID=UPI0004F5999A|nr:response regulator transcription factor [Paenibacillus sp. FSL H7-0357]AIQ17608.1 heme response regulator HssR [Paenibacillus sp. FSL H7-0357]
MITILVVEDNETLRQLICTVLGKHGYRVLAAEDGQSALDILEAEYIDLIISDIMMPQVDGYELIEHLRQSNNNLPVLIITAKDSFQDKQKGFLVGTDDYMVKPVDINEMVLRVGALLRRAQIVNERKLTVGGVTLDYDSVTVYRDGDNTVLPQKEFFLLYKLIAYPNKIFTRQQLMDEIWGMDTETDARTVDVHINRLRERFREYTEFEIVTVRGLGYKAVKHI